MLIEIEETVRFLASFLIGKIPRRRLDDFIETLANLLVERFLKTQNRMRVCKFIVNVNGLSDIEIKDAASEAQINEERVRSLWPKCLILEIQPGMIMAVNAETGGNKIVYPIRHQLFNHAPTELEKNRRTQQASNTCSISSNGGNVPTKAPCNNARERLLRRTQMRIVWASSYDGFACEPGYDMGCGFHPFTSPSVYSYVQMLFLLNSLASWVPDKTSDSNREDIEKIFNSNYFHPQENKNAEADEKSCSRELDKEMLETTMMKAGPDLISEVSFASTVLPKVDESGDSKQEFA